VTTPGLRPAAEFVRGYLGQIVAVAERASQTDKAGQWGVDGWVRVIHDLIDVQVRAYAGLVHLGMGGPPPVGAPGPELPPEPVPVPGSKPYPRRLDVSALTRVGRPDVTLPRSAVQVDPELPAGAARFHIRLLDGHYLGHNYTGSATLTVPDTNAVDAVFDFTVGL